MAMMTRQFVAVSLGEALFDLFPRSERLGGAPLNVALHAHQLAAPLGGKSVLVSRVGQDDRGANLLSQLQQRGLSTDTIQTDPDHDTGVVHVRPAGDGRIEYEITPDAAWDWIQFDPDLEQLAQKCDAVCFGTLAQRCGQSRSAILRFLTTARRAIKILDVNLRDQVDPGVLHRSCEFATVVKCNRQELPIVAELLGIDCPAQPDAAQIDNAAVELLRRFELNTVVITRSAAGTLLVDPQGRHEVAPAEPSVTNNTPSPDADAVGAGDAATAALMIAMILRWPVEKMLTLANQVGAYVASQPGATPVLPQSILDLVQK